MPDKKKKSTLCPRCKMYHLHDERPALNPVSHLDNKTHICQQCGIEEWFLDYGTASATNVARHQKFAASLGIDWSYYGDVR